MAPLAPHTHRKRGWVKDQPLRYVRGHNGREWALPADAGVVGSCQCGCGNQTSLAERTVRRRNWKKGYPKPFLPGHSSRNNGGVEYVVDDNGCWVWQKARFKTGYGQTSLDRKTVSAHRLYYERANGPVPDGLHLDHLCRNRACVNPEHLEAVTLIVNVQRGANAKMTPDAVRKVRSRYAEEVLVRKWGAMPKLADEFGVTRDCIKDIVTGRTWKNLL